MPLEPLKVSGIPRRAFLVMPFAFAGLIALFRRPERSLPDAAANGHGPSVTLVLFSNRGECLATVAVHKIIKTDSTWRSELTGEQYRITRRRGTEFAFANRYWNSHAPGIYRCICCGNALFRSHNKFDSGTGWPSFSTPIAAENVYTQLDSSLGFDRIEVLCRKCDAHLGHVFDDGPPPTHFRYCINSAALQLTS